MDSIVDVLMQRDGISRDEAEEAVNDARELVRCGADVEEVLSEEFGLEPDYMWDLLP